MILDVSKSFALLLAVEMLVGVSSDLVQTCIAVASDDGCGNGVTMTEYTIQANMKDGSKFWPEQVQVSLWENGKIVELKYYYNPNF